MLLIVDILHYIICRGFHYVGSLLIIDFNPCRGILLINKERGPTSVYITRGERERERGKKREREGQKEGGFYCVSSPLYRRTLYIIPMHRGALYSSIHRSQRRPSINPTSFLSSDDTWSIPQPVSVCFILWHAHFSSLTRCRVKDI